MSTTQMTTSACDEIKLKVAPKIMNHPLGFTFDAGGSLIKLTYRSKEDYTNGKPLRQMDHGILTLKSFTLEGGFSEFLDFIEANVDIALNESHEGVKWGFSGLTTQHFNNAMEEKFKIKTKCLSEFLLFSPFLDNYKQIGLAIHSTNVENVKECFNNSAFDPLSERMMMMDVEKDVASVFETFLNELKSIEDFESLIDQHLKHNGPIKTPSLIIMVGSATFLYMINNEYKVDLVDVFPICGKSIAGLAEEMFGTKDFDKFIKLCESGNSGNVDYYAKDLCPEVHKENDWYNAIHGETLIYSLGKMSSINLEGKGVYSKADAAAGVLSYLMYGIAKGVVLRAMIHNVDTVYACGSFFQPACVRKLFEKHVFKDSLRLFIPTGRLLKLHIFECPGYLISLGAWVLNVEEERNRVAQKQPSKM